MLTEAEITQVRDNLKAKLTGVEAGTDPDQYGFDHLSSEAQHREIARMRNNIELLDYILEQPAGSMDHLMHEPDQYDPNDPGAGAHYRQSDYDSQDDEDQLRDGPAHL